MSFVVRFLTLVVITICTLAPAKKCWSKYNLHFMVGYLIIVGVIFSI